MNYCMPSNCSWADVGIAKHILQEMGLISYVVPNPHQINMHDLGEQEMEIQQWT